MERDDISAETARILYLAYGKEAVEMAELRCKELQASRDRKGLESWRRVLAHVRALVAVDPGSPTRPS
jgi:hypothetical protein